MDYDFDMTVGVWGESLSPGNEQRNYWGSEAADRPGSRNLAGVKNPVVAAPVAKMMAAPKRESLIASTRALDRALPFLSSVIPPSYRTYDVVVYCDKFVHPANT